MRPLLALALVLTVSTCSAGEDTSTVTGWLAADDGARIEAEHVDCVALEIRRDLSEQQLAEMVELDTSGWSEDDYFRHGDIMDPLGAAEFACMGSALDTD